MADPISRDEVLAIARLANLDLAEGEIDRMTRDLGAILGYVQTLNEVDTTAVEPMTHVSAGGPKLRPDLPHAELSHDVALREAPRTSQGGFAVPGFVEED